jgi:N-acetylmuramoyl-L-alanine amidase
MRNAELKTGRRGPGNGPHDGQPSNQAGPDDRIAAMLLEAGFELRRIPSPNHGPRPEGLAVDTLVIHYTNLPRDESLRVLSDPERQVSTHFLIAKGGELCQLVSVERRAWHAGASELGGRPDVNSRSIGIDLEFVADRDSAYTEAQYASLAVLARALLSLFPIPRENIVGHEHVAMPKGRKLDPGPLFDWPRFLADCRA